MTPAGTRALGVAVWCVFGMDFARRAKRRLSVWVWSTTFRGMRRIMLGTT